MFKNLMAVLAILCLAGPALAVTPALGTPVCPGDSNTCVTDGASVTNIVATNAIGVNVLFLADADVHVDGDAACAALSGNLTCALTADLSNADAATIGDCTTDASAAEWYIVGCY